MGTIYSPPGGDRHEPYVSPTHGNGAQVGPGGRSGGVAQNHVLGGVNYGTLAHANVRAASGPRMTGQATRGDPAQLSRLPVSLVRPVWARISLLGAKNSEMPSPAISPPSPVGTVTHGPECLDCAGR
jgi:hypothetical protein